MDAWGYHDKETIFLIRPLQIKNRIAITTELFEELQEPKEISFTKHILPNNTTTIIIHNTSTTINGEKIATTTIEQDKKSGRKRMVIPKEVLQELDYTGNNTERIAIYKTRRNGYKTIEIVNLNITLVKRD